jgi:pimeloyl-ACP methyl ester carboxylesterase
VTLIPFEDHGGRGPALHFAHANAYPPGSYRRFLTLLAESFQVTAVHHRPLWPGSDPATLESWHDIANDLIAFFDQRKMAGAVGVGHSLGGVVTMMASLKRPELFRLLILIDPVFLPPPALELFSGPHGPFSAEEQPLVQGALKRRNEWPSRQAAFERFRAKGVFSRLSDEVLWDYVRHGTRETGDGRVELAYSAAWEARIYALPPTDVWHLIPQVSHPMLAIRGAESDTLLPEAWALWQQLQPQATFVEVADSGHLLPMERPEVVAGIIGDFAGEG